MDEDLYEPLREVGAPRCVECPGCGRLVPAGHAKWIGRAAPQDAAEGYLVCPECASDVEFTGEDSEGDPREF
jgi:hypothetical protein